MTVVEEMIDKIQGEGNAITPAQTLSRIKLDGYIDEPEFARWMGRDGSSMWRWRAKGFGPPFIRIRGTILYKISSIKEWLASLEQKPKPLLRRRRVAGRKRSN